MTIDSRTEKLIPLFAAGNALPMPTKPSRPTLWRWKTRGVRGRVLETIRVGGRIYTSIEALERFLVHAGGEQRSAAIRSPRRRERDIREAERELAAGGLEA
jgi:hypothetical protein